MEDAKSQLHDLLAKHSELFKDSYEGMKGLEAHITMKDGAKPILEKPRRVPYALKDEVERELDKLEKNGVIIKTERSDWASPIVVVPKADNSEFVGTTNMNNIPFPPNRTCMLLSRGQNFSANLICPMPILS